MRKFEIVLPTGASRLAVVEGRPSFIPDADIVLGASDTFDFDALTALPDFDTALILSAFLGKHRGLPRDSLTVAINGTPFSIPKFDTPYGIVRQKAPNVKLFPLTCVNIGGIDETVYTARGERCVRAVAFGDRYPKELLRRLCVIDGAPTADIVISSSTGGEELSMITTGDGLTYSDAASALVALMPTFPTPATSSSSPIPIRVFWRGSILEFELLRSGEIAVVLDLDRVKISTAP